MTTKMKGILTAVFAASLLARGAAADVAGVCSDWKVVATPQEWDGVDPTAIAARGASNAWAIGHFPVDPASETTLSGSAAAMRWDGSTWQFEKLPDLAHLGTQPTLKAVAIAPRGDAWVVGHLSQGGTNVPLILQWHGGFWQAHQVVMLDSFAPRQARFRDVTTLTDEEAWAVGDAATIVTAGAPDARFRAPSEPFAARWDGNAWVEVPVPATGGHVVLSAVAATERAAWAVGYALDAATGASHARIYSWDGTEWSIADQPAAGKAGSVLHDVVALAANDVWAVGTIGTDRGLFLHFDGSTWTSHAAPPYALPRSVDGSASNDVWAVGSTGRYRWDGKSWALDKPTDRISDRRAVAVAGPCDVWAISARGPASDTVTILERLVPPTTDAEGVPAPDDAVPTTSIPEPSEETLPTTDIPDPALQPITTTSIPDPNQETIPTTSIPSLPAGVPPASETAGDAAANSIPLAPGNAIPAPSNSIPQAPGSDVVFFAANPRPAPPAPPVGLVAVGAGREIVLSWRAGEPADTSLAMRFLVQRCTAVGGVCVSRFAVIAKVEGPSFVDSQVKAGEEYGYRVLAVNAAGESAPTETVTAATVPDTDPASVRLPPTNS